MAAFGRSLCLILTLWMAGSSPPTVIPPRSPDSSPWWDQASLKIQTNALRLRKAGDFRAADALYQRGLSRSRAPRRPAGFRALSHERGRLRAARAFSIAPRSPASCARAIWQPRLAITRTLGAIAVNLSSLYLEMWDLPSASAPPKKACAKTALLERAR